MDCKLQGIKCWYEFYKLQMKRKYWDSEKVESHFIENNEDNGFQILKTTGEHLHFWLFFSMKPLGRYGCLSTKSSLGVDWH